MARAETIIVGGGINPGVPFVLNGFTFVQQANPPVIASSPVMFQVLGANQAVVIAASGVDPQPAATEPFRVSGGMICQPLAKADFVSIGRAQTITGANPNVAIGTSAVAASAQVVIGDQANGGANAGTVAIGRQTSASGGSGVAINGTISSGGAGASVAIQGTITTNGNSVAIGGAVNTNGDSCVAVGMGSAAQAFGAVAVGQGASCSGAGSAGVAIGGKSGGNSARANADRAIAIGFGCQSDAAGTIVMGGDAKGTHVACIIMGQSAASTQANQCMLGGPNTIIQFMIVGRGDTAAAVTDVLCRLTNRTGAGNLAGSDLKVQAGAGVGNDLSKGTVTILTPQTAGGGVTQAFVTRAQFPSGGSMVLAAPDAAGVSLSLGGFGGAGQASVNFLNLTNGAGAQAGTLLNSPVLGNPTFWLPVQVAGVTKFIPCW